MIKQLFFLMTAMVALHVSAQTEVGSEGLSGKDIDVQKMDVGKQLQADSMRYRMEMMQPQFSAPTNPAVQSFTNLTKQGGTGLHLWKGAVELGRKSTLQKKCKAPSRLRPLRTSQVPF